MRVSPVSAGGNASAEAPADRKVAQAARDFEALLVSQMLRSAHGEGGWLGTGDDQADDAAMGMGEEQLAQALANGGGLGLAKMIQAELSKKPAAAADATAAPPASAPNIRRS